MKLPTAAMKPTGTNVGESVTNSRIGADACINIDDADRKRSVSFAPASNEDDVNRISIGNSLDIQMACMNSLINWIRIYIL